jgi:hypothetical protein
MTQKKMACFQEIENSTSKDDMFVHLTIYDVSASLLREFSEKIVKLYYPGGVSEAIKDLVRKAILEQQFACTSLER